MNSDQQSRQALILGVIIAGIGLMCLGGGVALLAWRVLAPEDAVILPPGIDTPEMTPTPGILGRPVPPPPLPDNPAQLVILPVSERPTPAPNGFRPAPSPTVIGASPSPTPPISPAPTLAPAAATSAAQVTPAPPVSTTEPVTAPPARTVAPVAPASPTRVTSSPAVSTAEPATVTLTPTATPAIPDRILINAIGLDAPIVPVGQHPLKLNGELYSQWDVPNKRAAGWQQSSAPLGQIGNTVLDGHHNVYGEVFHHLVLLKPGDIVTLESHGRPYYYIVAQTMTLAEEGQPVEIRQANARWILPTDDERVTLITCWPYNANTHRLVVIALPIAELGDAAQIP